MSSFELDLDEFEILKRYKSDDYYKFEVIRKDEPCFCTKCMTFVPLDGSWKFQLHDTRKRTVIDERIRRKKVVIVINQRRYNCPACGERFVECIESVAPHDKVTKRLWETLGIESLKGNYKEVGEYYGVSDTTTKKAFDDLIAEKDKNRVLKAPEVLGIDEIYVKLEKGKRKEGCAVFTDVKNHRILEFIRSTAKHDVVDVIKSMQDYENIKIVTMDMASAYRNAVKDTLPKAFAVVDHFHVIQKCNIALDTIRNAIQDQLDFDIAKLKNDGKKDKKLLLKIPPLEKDRIDIFKVRYYLRYGREMLDADQAQKLTVQLNKYPKLQVSYWLKEGLRDVYDCKTKYDAYQAYWKWEQQVNETDKTIKIPEIVGIQRMINNLKHLVFAYFDGNYTNAYAESFNNLIGRIVRFGNGYRFESLRGKILYGTEATKPTKFSDADFYAIDNALSNEIDFSENDNYATNDYQCEGFGVDFLELLSIIEKGKFRV